MRDSLRRSKAAFDDRLAYCGFHNGNPVFILFAFAAGVNQANVFAYLYLCRNDYKLVPGIPTHNMKWPATLRANTLGLRQIVLHNFNRQILRQLVRCEASAFTVVLLDLNELWFCHDCIGKKLSFIEN